MEWDTWPNQGYPCQECGERFECSPLCKLRENDPIKREYCDECKAELPGHVAANPRCSKLPYEEEIKFSGLHCSCCGSPIEFAHKKITMLCFTGQHGTCVHTLCECDCHE